MRKRMKLSHEPWPLYTDQAYHYDQLQLVCWMLPPPIILLLVLCEPQQIRGGGGVFFLLLTHKRSPNCWFIPDANRSHNLFTTGHNVVADWCRPGLFGFSSLTKPNKKDFLSWTEIQKDGWDLFWKFLCNICIKYQQLYGANNIKIVSN